MNSWHYEIRRLYTTEDKCIVFSLGVDVSDLGSKAMCELPEAVKQKIAEKYETDNFELLDFACKSPVTECRIKIKIEDADLVFKKSPQWMN